MCYTIEKMQRKEAVMKNQQKILLFHVDREKQAQLSKLCLSMGIQMIFIEKSSTAKHWALWRKYRESLCPTRLIQERNFLRK